MPVDQRGEGGRVAQAAYLGLAERALELTSVHDRSEVEKGPGHGRDRDPILAGDLVGMEPAATSLDLRGRVAFARGGHLDA